MPLKTLVLSACAATTLAVLAGSAAAGGLANPSLREGFDLTRDQAQPVYYRCYWKRVRYYDPYTHRYYYRNKKVCY